MIPGFSLERFTHDGETRDVYRRGTGPGVVVMPELPGITPEVARFATWVADAGFSVYLPDLFGTPMKPVSRWYVYGAMARACVSREFRVFASNASSPIVDWLRALARTAHAEQGGKGVGAVGMCITGNFVVALMLDAKVLAPVMSQPSLPLQNKGALHLSPEEIAGAKKRIAEDGARILGLRFHRDPFCPAERFARLREEFGEAFESIEIDPRHGDQTRLKPIHSVLTTHLIDRDGEPTKDALNRTLAFLKEQLL